MSRKLIFFCLCIGSCNFLFGQYVPYTKEVIYNLVRKTDSLFSTQNKSFSLKGNIPDKKGINEKWEYLKTTKGLLCLKINYTIDSTDYFEEYFLDNDNLIFAAEREVNRFPGRPDDFIVWSGSYYFSNKKMIDLITLGHGKSELDNWDPEKETLLRFAKRNKEYRDKIKY